VWDDFLVLRKTKRAPLTQTALNSIAKEAQCAGVGLERALVVCCERGWQGFQSNWYLKDQGGKPAQQPAPKLPTMTTEQRAAAKHGMSLEEYRAAIAKPQEVA
jgi:hypothetical protein